MSTGDSRDEPKMQAGVQALIASSQNKGASISSSRSLQLDDALPVSKINKDSTGLDVALPQANSARQPQEFDRRHNIRRSIPLQEFLREYYENVDQEAYDSTGESMSGNSSQSSDYFLDGDSSISNECVIPHSATAEMVYTIAIRAGSIILLLIIILNAVLVLHIVWLDFLNMTDFPYRVAFGAFVGTCFTRVCSIVKGLAEEILAGVQMLEWIFYGLFDFLAQGFKFISGDANPVVWLIVYSSILICALVFLAV
ncbi:hypothetical protein RUND412_004821 [Rhizina undulata]